MKLQNKQNFQNEMHEINAEIKELTKLVDVHLAQAINYLEACNIEIGLLINFGAKSNLND